MILDGSNARWDLKAGFEAKKNTVDVSDDSYIAGEVRY